MSRINVLLHCCMLPWGRKSMYGPLLDPQPSPHSHQTNPYIDFLPLFQRGALLGHGLAQDLLHQLKLLCPLTQTRRSELVAPWLTNSLIRALVAWVPHHSPPHPPPFFHLHTHLIHIVKGLIQNMRSVKLTPNSCNAGDWVTGSELKFEGGLASYELR